MGFEIGGTAEALAADVASMGLLSCVHQMVFLQMSKLGEALFARDAHKRTLACVRAQVNLQITQLTKRFVADITLVVHFTVFLL